MKKKIMAILGAAAVACVGAALIAGCSDGGNNNNNNNDDKDTFTITVESGTGYTAKADKQKAEFGDTVTITVEVTNPDMYIEGVFANSNELDENSDGKYTATVTTNLTIKVEMGEYKEVLENGGITFSKVSNPTTIAVNESNTSGWWKGGTKLKNYLQYKLDLNWSDISKSFSPRSYVTSSNENVIPNDEDVVYYEFSSDKKNININIDSSKIKEGTTWLTMYFQSNTSSSTKATLCVKITVTAESSVIKTEKWKETIIFDISDVIDSKTFDSDLLYFQFIDNDYTSSMDSKERQEFMPGDYTVKDGKVTLEIEYVKDHEYRIYVGIEGSGDSLVLGDNINGTGGSYSHTENVLKFQTTGGNVEIHVYDERQ